MRRRLEDWDHDANPVRTAEEVVAFIEWYMNEPIEPIEREELLRKAVREGFSRAS